MKNYQSFDHFVKKNSVLILILYANSHAYKTRVFFIWYLNYRMISFDCKVKTNVRIDESENEYE